SVCPLVRRPPSPPLFPYTTLFRSGEAVPPAEPRARLPALRRRGVRRGGRDAVRRGVLRGGGGSGRARRGRGPARRGRGRPRRRVSPLSPQPSPCRPSPWAPGHGAVGSPQPRWIAIMRRKKHSPAPSTAVASHGQLRRWPATTTRPPASAAIA